MLNCDIVRAPLPVFVTVKVSDFVWPFTTLPKAKLAGVMLNPASAPVPVREIITGEWKPSMVIVTVPDTLPAAVGANTALRVAVAPTSKVNGAVIPFTLKPVPETTMVEIGTAAVPVLVKLGTALSDPSLKGSVYLINGYTDAAGSPDYNLALSQRRADAVRSMLIQQFQIPPTSLVAVGFGKEQLKNPADPLGNENRRVQIVNTNVTASH